MITKYLINVMSKACFKTSIIDTSKMNLKKIWLLLNSSVQMYDFHKNPSRNIRYYLSRKIHDDVMTWIHSPHHWPFVRGGFIGGAPKIMALTSYSTAPREISILTTGAPLIRTAPPRTKWQADISMKKQTMLVGAVQGMEWLRALMTLKCQTCMGIQWYWGCSWQEVTDVTVTSHQW